jgi:hypothetical protein
VDVELLRPEQPRALLFREARIASQGIGDEAAVETVCRLLGGLPFALRLAGVLLRGRENGFGSLAELLKQRGAVSVLSVEGIPLVDYRDNLPLTLRALLAENWDTLPDSRPEKEILKALACLPESEDVRVGLLRHLVECSPDPLGFRDSFQIALDELFDRNLLERPDPDHVRLHALLHEYVRGQVNDDLAATLAERAASKLCDPHYVARWDRSAFLTLRHDLQILKTIAVNADEARDRLHRLQVLLQFGGVHLTRGLDLLQLLYQRALIACDNGVVQAIDGVLAQYAEPWLRCVWSTDSTDPARPRWEKHPYAHADRVLTCAISADGRVALSGAQDGTLRLWSAGTGECQALLLPACSGRIVTCALSADGNTVLAWLENGAVQMWNGADSQWETIVPRQRGSVWPGSHHVWARGALSTDERTALLGLEDGTVQVWDVRSRKCRGVLRGHVGLIRGCALSNDGTLALSGSVDRTLRLWNIASGKAEGEAKAVLHGHEGPVWTCALSADGTVALSGAGDGTARVWDTATGECRMVLAGHGSGFVWACGLSGDGRTAVTGSTDRAVRIWDTASGVCEVVMPIDGLMTCALSTDGRRAFAGDVHGNVSLFEVVRPWVLS